MIAKSYTDHVTCSVPDIALHPHQECSYAIRYYDMYIRKMLTKYKVTLVTQLLIL